MKVVTMTEMRRHWGRLFRDVHLRHETIVIQRRGKPVAMLTPPEPVVEEVKREAEEILAAFDETRAKQKPLGPDESIKRDYVNAGRKY